MDILFGTAGVPRNAPDRSTLAGLDALSLLDLDCMEIEFVQRVSMGAETAAKVRQEANARGIALSVHAPYYINLNAHEENIRLASRKRLKEAARVGALCGATDIVFHPGFYLGDSARVAFKTIQQELLSVTRELVEEQVGAMLRAETTGKPSQFGSLEEILNLAQTVLGVGICIDFSHLHARSPYQMQDEFVRDLERVRIALGHSALEQLHVHVSGMHYTKKGERNHLNLKDSDFPYLLLLQALKSEHAGGRLICESPNLEKDALLLKKRWKALAVAESVPN
jgi:deoxyribonuclease-4